MSSSVSIRSSWLDDGDDNDDGGDGDGHFRDVNYNDDGDDDDDLVVAASVVRHESWLW